MVKRIRWHLLGLSSLLVMLGSAAFGRSKDEGFPDYNHLEYAKPMPAPDDQPPQPPPGSIHMEVGGPKSDRTELPEQDLSIPMRPVQKASESEPPLDFFDAGSPSSAAAISTSSAPVNSQTLPPKTH